MTPADRGQIEKSPAFGQPASFVLRTELLPVLSRAMSTVIEALEFDEETPVSLIRDLKKAAGIAMAEAYEPIADAASRLADAVVATRTTEAASVRKRAAEVATVVSQTATAVQQRQQRLSERLAQEATAAARTAAASSVPGSELDAKRRAIHDANAARTVAAARAEQWAACAARTAAAADEAAARLTVETDRAAVVVERDALHAAAVVEAAAFEMVYEVAVNAAFQQFLLSPPTDERLGCP